LVDFISLDFKTHQTDFEDLTGSKKFSQFEKTLEILLESKNAFEVRSTIHSELIRPKDLEKMIQFLREKRYKQPYYLQPYRNGVKTLTELQSSIISEEFKQIVSADFDIIWRE
jgi:pyruvate formate lyase activating enzyme